VGGSYESPEASVQGGRKGDTLVAILRCSQFVVHCQYYDNQQLCLRAIHRASSWYNKRRDTSVNQRVSRASRFCWHVMY